MWLKHFALCLLVSTSIVQAGNPLATKDQKELDELSKSLLTEKSLNGLREKARQQFVKSLRKYHVQLTDEVNKDLDIAMDELVFSSIQKAVNNDPSDPKVYWTDTARRSHDWFGLNVPGGRYSYDNPDCIYRIIPVSDKHKYRIRGRRFGNGTADQSFSVINNPNSQGTVAALYKQDLKVNDDGTYEIIISSGKKEGQNHIKSDWSAKQVYIRNNLGDWSNETPDELSVEIISDTKKKSTKKRSRKDILKDAEHGLKQSIFFYGFGALDFKTLSQPLNHLPNPDQSSWLGTLTSQAQSFSHFKLKSDEAFVITLTSGKSSYWVLPVTTMGLLTQDPENNIVSFNPYQSAQNKNGSYTFVLSAKDTGIRNWIDTSKLSQGTLMVRWQGLPKGDGTAKGIQLYSQVVKIDDLDKVLPSETERLDEDGRQRQIEQRRREYRRIHFQ